MLEILKKNKWLIIITCIVILLPIVAGVVVWDKLPAQVATHFNAEGVADGWSSKAFAVFGIPLIMLGAHVLCVFAMMLDPKADKNQPKIIKLVLWLVPVMTIFVQTGVLCIAMGIKMDISLLINIMVSLIFIIIGNYLPKCKQNYTVGIKLPWTLNDEEVWNKTHRLSGVIWTIGGLILLVNAFKFNEIVFAIVLIIMVFLPMAYSVITYSKLHKDDKVDKN